jgi:hypothetical protein
MPGYLYPLNDTLYPLSGVPVTGTVVAPFIEARLILTAPTVAAITLSPGPSGAPVILPAGTGPGVVKLVGSSGTNMTALVASPADAAVAWLAIRSWEPLLRGTAMNQAEAAASPYSLIPPVRGTAVFLAGQQQGTVSGSPITSGVVAISGAPLSGALTLRAPNGWIQTLAAGSSGVVALAGMPTGPGVTWNFANPSDANACDVVVAVMA